MRTPIPRALPDDVLIQITDRRDVADLNTVMSVDIKFHERVRAPRWMMDKPDRLYRHAVAEDRSARNSLPRRHPRPPHPPHIAGRHQHRGRRRSGEFHR
ncbi:hypothetical protein ACFYPT_41485 [Streptomyces sp. NPDC005529]|uniref:hypothetical protein n=1 Tax=unclassified Streptomyces TaxID=2593676 RepID=UPI0033A4313F